MKNLQINAIRNNPIKPKKPWLLNLKKINNLLTNPSNNKPDALKDKNIEQKLQIKNQIPCFIANLLLLLIKFTSKLSLGCKIHLKPINVCIYHVSSINSLLEVR